MFLLGMALLFFAVDAINSFFNSRPDAGYLYPSQNWLRLISGTTFGLAIPLLLVPIFNQTIWTESIDEPSVGTFRQYFLMLAVALLLDLAILADIAWVRFIFAILTIGTIVFLLSMVYTVLWVIIFKKEYQFKKFNQLWIWFVAGFGTTFLQISIFDAIRFASTGTWAGFTL